MRKILVLKMIVALMLTTACSGDHSSQIKTIWILKDVTWQESKTGITEIDTARKEAYTEILVLYDDLLVHGNISLYKDLQNDTIVTVYEAGQMQFTGNGCLKVKEIIAGKSIATSDGLISFQDQNTLLYKNKLFEQTENVSHKNKSELNEVLKRFCR